MGYALARHGLDATVDSWSSFKQEQHKEVMPHE